ncbi:glycoside hydrolase family 76 protein [Sphingomonas sp. RHCKR7]|uniref:glycoside hydrolase family 76 protein n=1 Tax=Sphingomonas folli TaxID=2862497 RepID=UPI001CA593A6|nr:glycoside hydrolase family 76 protein [Sphingomonas folli]MBW6526423.1 glycoside hydrolase family 76 protein [Sphingomonas folli]
MAAHPTRRAVVGGALALAGARGTAAPAPDHGERALAWHGALERAFAVGDGTGLYREYHPPRPSDELYSTEWPFSQAHVALLDLAMMPGAAGRRFAPALATVRAAQQRYWSRTSTTGVAGHLAKVVAPLGHGDDLYYDDNEWVGLAEVQHHLYRRDAESLRRARAIFALVRSGWSEEKGLRSPGGVVWTQKRDNGDRNTVSNMPAAELGARLYLITRERAYLDDALRYYRWTNATLQRRDGLYADHIKRDGTIEPRVWSYNQGVPVGVNVLLWRATGEARYLAEARRVAAASHDRLVAPGQVDDQPPPFNAIYFKNLLLLAHATRERRDVDAMRGYADRMWRGRRNDAGLVQFGGRRAELIDTAALVQVEAVLAWRPADWAMLY